MLATTGWGLLLQSWVVHHSTVWRISALPSQLFFSLLGYPQNPLAPEGFNTKDLQEAKVLLEELA